MKNEKREDRRCYLTIQMTPLVAIVGFFWCACASPGVIAVAHPREEGRSISLSGVNSAAAFAEVTSKYARCHTYKDRGTVVSRILNQDGKSSMFVNRFDTTFIRGRGFRFRYFEDDGRLSLAIWEWDEHALQWWWGSARAIDTTKTRVLDVMASLKGATNLSSWFGPRLLAGQTIESGDGPAYAGADLCEGCVRVEFQSPSKKVTTELLLDLHSDVVRRISRVDVSPAVASSEALKDVAKALTVIDSGPKQAEPKNIETFILYDTPTFDGDESALAAEMEKRPW